jgi:hypothetical protein
MTVLMVYEYFVNIILISKDSHLQSSNLGTGSREDIFKLSPLAINFKHDTG